MSEMAFCDTHWTRLREAVEEQGLGDIVSDGGRQAATRQVEELGPEADWSTFDPLMYAFWNLLANGSQIVNIPLLKIDGCPICWLKHEHDRTCTGDPRCPGSAAFEEWINKAADAASREWERRVSEEVSGDA